MPIVNSAEYLAFAAEILRTSWPQNRTVNMVCHGHSAPAGMMLRWVWPAKP